MLVSDDPTNPNFNPPTLPFFFSFSWGKKNAEKTTVPCTLSAAVIADDTTTTQSLFRTVPAASERGIATYTCRLL